MRFSLKLVTPSMKWTAVNVIRLRLLILRHIVRSVERSTVNTTLHVPSSTTSCAGRRSLFRGHISTSSTTEASRCRDHRGWKLPKTTQCAHISAEKVIIYSKSNKEIRRQI